MTTATTPRDRVELFVDAVTTHRSEGTERVVLASDHGRAQYADRLVRLDLAPEERERLDDLLDRFHVFKVKQPETRKADEGVVYVSAKADPKHAADFLEGVFRVVFDAPEDYELRVEQERVDG